MVRFLLELIYRGQALEPRVNGPTWDGICSYYAAGDFWGRPLP
jgi:hypothetical protein